MSEDGSPSRHLVLVGLPGAGKSGTGRVVARRLGVPFIDFDRVIAERSGLSVADFFARHGEPAFRALEVALTRELVDAPAAVLAPGGGWVTNPGVMELLRPPARIAHLRIRPAAAVNRLRRSATVRPLLETPDPLGAMRRLWESRQELYARADLEVDVEVVGRQRLVELLAALARDGSGEVG